MAVATIERTNIAGRLLRASTTKDIEQLLAQLPNQDWKPLGGKPGNFAIVNIGSDPGDGLVEKVTNGIDAILEREALLAGRTDFENPRAAADALLGVPGGHVANVKDDGADRGKRRQLAQRLVVTLRDSGVEKQPTAVIEDQGIGQHPDDFAKTLVSLNEENKRNRLYLMGAYGWGGASAFGFTKYAVYVSRRDPRLLDAGQKDEVGWTIVRYNPLEDDLTSKHGVYEFLSVIDGGQAHIPWFDPDDLPADHRDWIGTNCTLVQYELSRYNDVVFRVRNSLWLLFNASLFDPIMPFLIRDERAKAIRARKDSSTEVTIGGNAARLAFDASKKQKNQRIAYSGSWVGRMDDGSTAVINYYLVEETGEYSKDRDPIWTYVPPEQAVTITHNGQRQSSYRRELFEKLNLLSLTRFLIVHVDCDNLSKRDKRELFSTTRDRLKDNPVAKLLLNMVSNALGSDAELRGLEAKRKQRALERRSQDQIDRINKMLEKAIQGLHEGKQMAFRKVVSANQNLVVLGDQLLVDETPQAAAQKREQLDVAKLPPPTGEPTQLSVVNPIVRIPAGGKAVVRLWLDASDGYISTGDTPSEGGPSGKFVGIVTKGQGIFRIDGYSPLRDQTMRCTVSAEGATPGDRGRVVFTVTRANELPLLAEAELEAVEPPIKRVKPDSKQPGKQNGPDVVPVHRDDWASMNFDESTVARVVQPNAEQQLTQVFVNWDYPALNSRVIDDKKLPSDKVLHTKEKFSASVALLALLQHNSQRDEGEAIPDETKQAELRRGAEMFLFAEFTD
jgi:hypothetical protein